MPIRSFQLDFCSLSFSSVHSLSLMSNLFYLQNNLHKPKSCHIHEPVREASIITVSLLSNDRQSTRSANSSGDQTLDVASRSSSRRGNEKVSINSSVRELRGCYERPRSSCAQVRPLFPNPRHQRVRTPLPVCATQPVTRDTQKRDVPSKHSVQIIQNFAGKSHSPPSPVAPKEPKNPEPQPAESKASSVEMSQDVGSCCAKYILCFFNFIFFVSIQRLASALPQLIYFFLAQILGSLVLGLGLWLLLDKNSIVSLLKTVNSEHVEVRSFCSPDSLVFKACVC